MGPALVLAFLGGLILGSFVTVVGYRVPRGESIVTGRSRCTTCGAQIAAYDNVPVFSWVLLRGRSRCCGERISPRYPLTELTLGALYVATVAVLWDDPTELILGLVFVTTLVAITLTDLERRVIPNKILIVAAVAGVAIAAAGDPGSLPERAIAAAAAGGGLFLVALAYPRGMGLGDVKLAAVMGLFLGRNVAPAFLVALLTGSIVGLALIARHGAEARKRAIPFGPFLAFGGVVGLLLGNQLVDLYLSTFS
ncbi:MAG: leader peptidase (prepilin peptidase) / N-methyltransferase [Solirubrobacterales bacterium]|nr:leader peptidase (prepilin peptidase) / N-methyltransferase [Solirubrobacterales bacterium]